MFLKDVDPEAYQSVDEQVIPMKSRINIKQYLPKKPKKWGIKNWVRAGVRAELRLELLGELRKGGIYGTGTMRSNRPLGGKAVLLTDKVISKQPRGTAYVATKNGVTVTKWFDRAPMLVASTCAGKQPQDKA